MSGSRPCPRCRAAPPAGAKACPECGQVLDTGALSSRHVGDRRIVTVLFTDISGFTAMSEHMDPEEVADIVNAFFRHLTEPIYRYGGVVDKYIGDAIMALFGVPSAHEDDAERALLAAWAMQEAALAFGERLARRTGLDLKVRIGLNTGLVIASEIGGEARRDFTVMGDTVNVAQRMEANAPVGGILLAGETRRMAGERFAYRELAPIKVKGRRQPVKCYVLEGVSREYTGTVDIVGRGRERAAIDAAWRLAQDGKASAAMLSGPRGIGKSALLRQAVASWRGTGRVLSAEARSFEQAIPLATAGSILRQALRLGPLRTEPDSLAGAIAQTWPARAADPEVARAFGYFLGEELSDGLTMEAGHWQAVAFGHVNALLAEWARWEPVAVVVDSADCLDEPSRAWVVSLARAAREAATGILVLLAGRDVPRDLQAIGEILPLRPVGLDVLSRADSADLAASELARQGVQVGPERIDGLLDRAGGNPAFIVALAETAGIAGTQGEELGGESALPLPVVAHLAAYLDGLGLSPGASWVLEVAATIGREADPAFLLAVAAGTEGGMDAEAAARELVARGVLARGAQTGGAFAFTDPLVREVAYERMLLKRRRAVHGAVASRLVAEGASPALAAEHFARADQATEAARHYMLAAERSLACHANQDALRLALEAEAWAGRAGSPDTETAARWLEVLAQAHAGLGDPAAAIRCIESRLVLGGSPDAVARARECHADLLARTGKLARALEVCDEAAGDGAVGIRERVRLRCRRAQVLIRLGRLDEALAECRESAAISSAEPAAAPFAGQLDYLVGGILLRRADLKGAMAAIERAIAHFHACGNLSGLASALADLGSSLVRSGRLAEAAASFDRGMEIATRIGDRRLRAALFNNQAMLVYQQGRIAEAGGFFAKALDMHGALGDDLGAGIALLNLGEVTSALGSPAEAERLLLESVKLFERVGARHHLAEAHRQLADVRLAAGSRSGALEALKVATRLAHETSQPELQGVTLRLLAEQQLALGRPEEALASAARSVEILGQMDAPLELGRSYASLALVLRASRKDRQALEAADKAAAILRSIGATPELDRLGLSGHPIG